MKVQKPQEVDNVTKEIFSIMNSNGGTNGIHNIQIKSEQIKLYQGILVRDGMTRDSAN